MTDAKTYDFPNDHRGTVRAAAPRRPYFRAEDRTGSQLTASPPDSSR